LVWHIYAILSSHFDFGLVGFMLWATLLTWMDELLHAYVVSLLTDFDETQHMVRLLYYYCTWVSWTL